MPPYGRNTAIEVEEVTPTGGTRQIIDRSQSREIIRTNSGSVALEIDAGQEGVIGIERVRPDVGDAAWNRDTGQAGAVRERSCADAGDAVGDGGVCQVGAVIERVGPDAGDAAGNPQLLT